MSQTGTKRSVKLGTRTVEFPSDDLQQLTDCNHLIGDIDALRRELEEKGYLYVRGFHDGAEVLQGRLAVLQYIQGQGEGRLQPDFPWEAGVLAEGCGVGCVPFMEGRNLISHSEAVQKVIEGPRPFKFFSDFFGEKARTLDYKWLRAMHSEGFTGAHVDNVYMCRGSPRLLTMWTPFGDLRVENGVLAVCEGSNRLPEFKHFQETYGNLDVDAAKLKGTGWYTCDPFEISRKFGGQWKTTDFQAGDVLIFNMRTVHMSTVNMTQYARVSCDTRWQPETDVADPRFVGDFKDPTPKYGLNSKDEQSSTEVTIEALRRQWSL